MKKFNFWMFAAILTFGLGMTLTSCSDGDNNDNPAGPVVPTTDDDNYKIEVGAGMKLPENEFLTKVPAATEYD